jgi:murein lipoprotein
MKKVVKLSMIALASSLVVACATNTDIENLQSQINGLDASIKQASADSASAQATAADAAARAGAAEAAANRAAQFSKAANKKLGKKVNRSMMQ